ncbi:MAG TPA: heavy metal translocating P-type ATPase [Bryobacteraceae bacterium]|nr:heavy metal translocating P-type ATPase [Bryobacteraceae bacterium]
MTATAICCALCGLECGRSPVTRRFGNDDHSFCCTGCLNVYAILSESGVLVSGQDFRDTELYRESLRLGLISNPSARDQPARLPVEAEAREVMLQVSGMWCTSCAWLIEHALRKERGVVTAEAFFASDLVKVKYCPQYLPAQRIVDRIRSLGYRASEYRGQNPEQQAVKGDLLLRLGVAAFLWLNVMSLSIVLYAGYFEKIADSVGRFLPFVLMGLATPAVFYSAWPVLRLAGVGLRHRTIRMETLLALGILAAYGSSAAEAFRAGRHFYFDTACAIVALVLAGKLAEQDAKDRAMRAITALYRMMPKKARRLVDGRERFVSIDAVESGMVFVVQAGERIPADGVVVEGRSHVDESVLTGESAPRARSVGDRVICGSVNESGVLHVRATNVGSESTLAQIIRAVEAAMNSRSEVQRQVDRVSRVFVPVVITVALATFGGWIAAGAVMASALMHAIAVLVIACPCALGIATPLAITYAVGAAARKHILVSDGRALETVRKVDAVVLDKTGTVTEGDFNLLEIAGEAADLPLVASLEAYSEHPIGRAVRRWAEREGFRIDSAREIEIHTGLGITGLVAGRRVFSGNEALFQCAPNADLTAKVALWERDGHTAVYFGLDGEPRGALAFGDRIKPAAAALVSELRRRGIRTLLVSGDARQTTAWVAKQIGVDEVTSEALPERKIGLIRDLQSRGAVVAMIGDGVNDAPSLAQANLGIALSSGTDVAMKAAPVVITGGSLLAVLEVFDLAHKTLRVVRQNLFWAFLYNTAGITLAAGGLINPIFAAAAMVLSSVSVIGNSRRLS